MQIGIGKSIVLVIWRATGKKKCNNKIIWIEVSFREKIGRVEIISWLVEIERVRDKRVKITKFLNGNEICYGLEVVNIFKRKIRGDYRAWSSQWVL